MYDGIGVPDEPYRYVQRPADKKPTADATSAVARTPVRNGVGTNGLTVSSAEQTSQFSLFMPPLCMVAPGGTIEVKAVPQAPTDHPPGAVIDGNVYVITVTDPVGPVTLNEKAAIATLYLRATSTQDGWVMHYRRTAADSWKALQTSRGGTDSFVASFIGPGQYALASTSSGGGGGTNLLPLVLLGGVVALVVVVIVVRLRATPE
jgi:hypothetical protein